MAFWATKQTVIKQQRKVPQRWKNPWSFPVSPPVALLPCWPTSLRERERERERESEVWRLNSRARVIGLSSGEGVNFRVWTPKPNSKYLGFVGFLKWAQFWVSFKYLQTWANVIFNIPFFYWFFFLWWLKIIDNNNPILWFCMLCVDLISTFSLKIIIIDRYMTVSYCLFCFP